MANKQQNPLLAEYLALDGQTVSGSRLSGLLNRIRTAAQKGQMNDVESQTVFQMMDNLTRAILAVKGGHLTIHIPNAAALGRPGRDTIKKYEQTPFRSKKRDHNAPPGGKAQRWHNAKGGIPVVLKKSVKDAERIPKSFRDHIFDDDYLKKYFGLRGIEYGNWLSEADRYNYLGGAALALYDIKLLLDFGGEKVGLNGKLGLAFGARGSGRAAAHFEPSTFAINLTRYSRQSARMAAMFKEPRSEAMNDDGGSAFLGHEYGHALDYYAGTFVEKNRLRCLSGGGSRSTVFTRKTEPTLTGLMEHLLDKIVNDPKGGHSKYYQRLVATVGADNDYWFRRNELFARAFEAYLAYKLKKRGMHNTYLTRMKYGRGCYLTHNEIRAIEPVFDKLIAALRKAIVVKK